jgi:hypothetical protein
LQFGSDHTGGGLAESEIRFFSAEQGQVLADEHEPA